MYTLTTTNRPGRTIELMPFSLGLSLFDDKILWLNEQLSNESEDVFALSVLMAD